VPPLRRWPAAVALGCLAACSTASPPPPRPPSEPVPASRVDLIEERALLLLFIDRQLYDEAAVAPFLTGNEALRERLAEALGQIGDARARRLLEALLADRAAAVRRAAAFALGELETVEARPALLSAVGGPDRETGALAVEALGKMATPTETVLAALGKLPAPERSWRLLPFLFRFKDDAALRAGSEGLAETDPALRAWAAYGLARDARPGAAPLLRPLLADPDPWVRGWAARGLGTVGDGGDLEGLGALLTEEHPGPVIQALRAAQRLVEGGKAPPPAAWRETLKRLFDDPRPGVGATALEAASSWLLDDPLGAALAERVARVNGLEPEAADNRGERAAEIALLALARGRDPRGAPLAVAWSRSPHRTRRLRAAEAAADLSDAVARREILARLEDDPWPAVRGAVLGARLGANAPEAEARQAARAALADSAPAVRAAAFDWFAEHPGLALDDLVAALATTGGETAPDARLAAVRAIGSRGKAERLEEGAAIEQLERLAEDSDIRVRRAAADALVSLGRPAPPLGSAAAGHPLEHYRTVLAATAAARRVDLRTRHGVIRLQLDCPIAPLTCLSFTQLAAQGFFDGLSFHRVVPDFVVQGGDPDGDGSGGPGYALRDEINRRRYRRGALGMALSGPDTGGSQFFITLSPQPHLDGGYTAFGEVVEGMDVVDRVVQGDRIERAVVGPPG
jgi:cyclophilin family peptidyl-prolyl cis-trans isomerase/HEAT repeat protein